MGEAITTDGEERYFAFQRHLMVDEQLRQRGISDERVLAAFESLPRHMFVPPNVRHRAYEDHPLPIGFGQTISQAFVVAFTAAALRLTGSERVLDVGTGSGYQAAALALLAAQVHTIEIIPELAQVAAPLLARLGLSNIHVHIGDGSKGWPDSAPYDAIAASAAPVHVPPALLDQLKEGGRLVLPVGEVGTQRLELWERKDEGFDSQVLLPVAYVPMRGEGTH